LRHELVEADLVVTRLAAGEAHERPHGDVEILYAEEAGSVAGELALAVPLEERELDRQERHPGEEGQIANAEVEEDDRDRHVGHVTAHDVAQLMSKYETLLLLI